MKLSKGSLKESSRKTKLQASHSQNKVPKTTAETTKRMLFFIYIGHAGPKETTVECMGYKGTTWKKLKTPALHKTDHTEHQGCRQQASHWPSPPTQHKVVPVRAFTFQLTSVVPVIHPRSASNSPQKNALCFFFLLFNLHSCMCVSWLFCLSLHIAQPGFRIAVYVSSPSLKQGILLFYNLSPKSHILSLLFICHLLHHPSRLQFLPLNDFTNLSTLQTLTVSQLHCPRHFIHSDFVSFQSWPTTYPYLNCLTHVSLSWTHQLKTPLHSILSFASPPTVIESKRALWLTG